MPLFVNGRFLTQPVSGVQRTAREVVRAMDRRIGSGASTLSDAVLVVPADAPADAERFTTHMRVRRGRLRGLAFEQLELPWLARGGLLLGLGNTGPLVTRRQVVFMYDANVYVMPQAFSRAFRLYYRAMLPLMGRIARSVLVDSAYAADELALHARIPRDRFAVAHLGADHMDRIEADDAVLDRHGLRGLPYVLAVSNRAPNKNFAGVAAAVRLLPDGVAVAIAGGMNPRIFGGAQEEFPGGVRLLGYVSDGELKALYRQAACFVYPSLHEGFGLPPVEAMRCGCPVVVSDRGSLPEICGDAAEYCDPLQPADIARAVRRVMEDAGRRELLRERGLQRAARFRWDHTAATVERVAACFL